MAGGDWHGMAGTGRARRGVARRLRQARIGGDWKDRAITAGTAQKQQTNGVKNMTPETIDRIRSLEEKDGTLTAESVLNDAANPASPLHSHFQWDDSKAAHAYRIDQARTLIRSVRLVITTNEVAVRTVAYVRDPNKPAQEGGYINTFRLRNTPDDAWRG